MIGAGITLTGADEKTPLRELDDLSRRPGVEIGILLSLNPQGRNRYPGTDWIKDAIAMLGRRGAVHVCGRGARAELFAGRLPWLRSAGRIQVNGTLSPEGLRAALLLTRPIITQHRIGEPDELLGIDAEGHQLLVDSSGGRGLAPSFWARPDTSKPVGFAGGLGPKNLMAELRKIEGVAQGGWWVDMESELRGRDDWFSLCKAHECVDAFHAWGRAHKPEPSR